MATIVPCVVDTGGTGDYPSVTAATAAAFGATSPDLVLNDERIICDCQATTGLADVDIPLFGYTTDATHYIKVWTDPANTGGDGLNGSFRHVGVLPTAGQKIYRLEGTPTSTIACVSDYCQFDGIAQVGEPSVAGGYALNLIYAVGVQISNCVTKHITKEPATEEDNNLTWILGFLGSSGDPGYMTNCLVYSDETWPCIAIGAIHDTTPGTVYLRYITIAKMLHGIYTVGSVVYIHNVLVWASGVPFVGVPQVESSHNAGGPCGINAWLFGDDGPEEDGPMSSPPLVYLGTDPAVVFVDYANDDFRLLGTCLIQDQGMPITGVTTDVAGVARGAMPDIGAYETPRDWSALYHWEAELDDEPCAWSVPRQTSDAYVLPERVGGPLVPPPPLPSSTQLPPPVLNPTLPPPVLPGGGPEIFPSNMEW